MSGSRAGRRRRTVLIALVLLSGTATGAAGSPPTPVGGATTPVALAAPYEYLGWGDPQPPTQVLADTGLHDLTLAFVLAHHGCDPEWDGTRPLLGGPDAAAIAAVRAAGGDVDVSVGGWSGSKLGIACRTVPSLTAAYQQVVADYGLAALDVDIEHTEYTRAPVRERVVEALAALQQEDPSLEISVTFGTTPTGPDADGVAMIDQAATLGWQPYAWTVMPFDFGVPESDMASTTIAAAEGLEADVAAAYDEPAATAWAHVGISSMNGRTDEADETVSTADFADIVAFAESEHVARISFWSVDRDRPCPAGAPTTSDSCSGIAQAPYAFSDLLAGAAG